MSSHNSHEKTWWLDTWFPLLLMIFAVAWVAFFLHLSSITN